MTFDPDLDRSRSEQLPVDPTLLATGKFSPDGVPIIRFSRVLHNGKARLRNPETGKPVIMTGDIKSTRPKGSAGPFTLSLFWRGSWVPVPTIAEFQEWTMDSVCPTPDGEIVEPDAPGSWLSLVGLV